MATALSYLTLATAATLGAWLAFAFVSFAALRFAGTATPAALLGGRIGGLAMLLPSFWFAIFLGAPLGGGLLIGMVGESGMQFGAVLGFAASLFCGVLLGAAVGGILAALLHWARHARSAA
jgi:hypothetical protein